MANYILDTNIVSELGSEKEGGTISNKLSALRDSDNCLRIHIKQFQ